MVDQLEVEKCLQAALTDNLVGDDHDDDDDR